MYNTLTDLGNDVAAAIREKDNTISPIPVQNFGQRIRAIPSSTDGGWTPPNDWWNIKTILMSDTTPGYGGKYAQLITDHNDSILLTGALAYRTSDGAFYSANTTHTWDKLQDKPCAFGYKTRYIIYYTNASSAVNLQAECLWVVMDLTLSSISTISDKKLLKAFEFINNKNIASTLTSLGSMFQNGISLVKIQDNLDFSNITSITFIFQGCYSLTKVPTSFDSSKVTTMQSVFQNCQSLISVPVLDFANVTLAANVFASVTFLKGLRIKNLKMSLAMPTNFLSYDDLMYTINNLQVVTNETLTLGATNLAKLTSTDIAIANAKGWTLA